MIITVAFSVVMMLISGFTVKAIANVKKIIATIKPEKQTDYTKQIKREGNIAPLLADIRHNTYADRVCVVQYHNGVHSIANNSLLKVSMTHERVGLNVPSIMNNVQSWPANYLGNINEQIFDFRYIAHPTLKSMAECPDMRGLYDQLKTHGVKSVYCFPIQDAYGKVFGIGVIQYVHKEHDLDSTWLKWTQARFTSIGALLAGVQDDGDGNGTD